MKRVVITGMGAVTPCGNTVSAFWDNIRAGQSGIDFITRFPTDDFKVKVAAEVKDFAPENYMERKETKRMDLYSVYAIAASVAAVADAKLTDDELRGNVRAGVILGSGIGGLVTMEEQVTRLNEKGPSRVAPLFIPMTIANMAAGNVAVRFGTTGICTSVVTACASGTNCIGEAFRQIKHGYADVILAGGAEAAVTRIGMGGFQSLTALSTSDDPARASIPFDEDRDGFVMGEGAGVVIVEELEHAQKRGATILAEIVGYGTTCDAYHMTSPNPEGTGAAAAMSQAISEAGIKPSDVSYINAHGTSTPHNDLPETVAIKKVFGEDAYKIPVSSTKSMTGHLLGAAGAVEAVVCVEALRNGFVPPTVGLETPGEGCDLNYVPKQGYEAALTYAISNSLGFGGHNAVLCFKKWEV